MQITFANTNISPTNHNPNLTLLTHLPTLSATGAVINQKQGLELPEQCLVTRALSATHLYPTFTHCHTRIPTFYQVPQRDHKIANIRSRRRGCTSAV